MLIIVMIIVLLISVCVVAFQKDKSADDVDILRKFLIRKRESSKSVA
jgi:hypothetical protein